MQTQRSYKLALPINRWGEKLKMKTECSERGDDEGKKKKNGTTEAHDNLKNRESPVCAFLRIIESEKLKLRVPEMETSMKALYSDIGLYLQSFELFLECSTEHQCMKKFIDENLPDIISSIGKKGVPSLNVLGVGSGSGEIDFEILSRIQSKYPGVLIHNEVVEPILHQISKYKELVKEKSEDLNISFTWNQMSSEEFEKQNKERKESKKFDFIHMIQMLYFVDNIHETIKYFHSLLETNGKLLIIHTSDDSGFHPLWKNVISPFSNDHLLPDVRSALDEMRMKYQIYKLVSDLDVTDCFIEGNENGEHMLDFITQVAHFRKTAPADLTAEVL